MLLMLFMRQRKPPGFHLQTIARLIWIAVISCLMASQLEIWEIEVKDGEKMLSVKLNLRLWSEAHSLKEMAAASSMQVMHVYDRGEPTIKPNGERSNHKSEKHYAAFAQKICRNKAEIDAAVSDILNSI